MANGERIALFIDGANLYATAKSLGFDIDYKRLLREFQNKGRLIRAFYYTALIEDQEYSSIRPLIDWLDYNGYAVVTKPTKEFVDSLGRRKVKGNMDIELAVNAMEMAEHLDHIVLFSGDGDFRSLVEAIQRKGVRVSVISTITTQPPMIADELRRQADEFIDLIHLANRIGRDPGDVFRAGEGQIEVADMGVGAFVVERGHLIIEAADAGYGVLVWLGDERDFVARLRHQVADDVQILAGVVLVDEKVFHAGISSIRERRRRCGSVGSTERRLSRVGSADTREHRGCSRAICITSVSLPALPRQACERPWPRDRPAGPRPWGKCGR